MARFITKPSEEVIMKMKALGGFAGYDNTGSFVITFNEEKGKQLQGDARMAKSSNGKVVKTNGPKEYKVRSNGDITLGSKQILGYGFKPGLRYTTEVTQGQIILKLIKE